MWYDVMLFIFIRRRDHDPHNEKKNIRDHFEGRKEKISMFCPTYHILGGETKSSGGTEGDTIFSLLSLIG